MLTVNGLVLQVYSGRMLVLDKCTGRRVMVYAPGAECFLPGQCVCIRYRGACAWDTDQITALWVCRIPC